MLKVFVCEFITGGGLYRELLPQSLAREGGMMLEALLSDLLAIPEVQITTTRDARLPPLSLPVSQILITEPDDVWQCWEEAIMSADAVWPIAPESGGVLERLSRLVLKHNKVLLNSTPEAVAITTCKSSTTQVLSAAGIATIPTFAAAAWPDNTDGSWVAKPDDGVGCEDIYLFDATDQLRSWLRKNDRARTHVVQPYLSGEAASLSLLCREGNASLLSCNRQLIEVRDSVFHYLGSVLNDMVQHWDRCDAVAQSVAQAIPGLAGYVGVDVLIQDDDVVVVEVNPRLTTSYAGLHRACGCNPARLVVDMIYNENFSRPQAIARNVVKVYV